MNSPGSNPIDLDKLAMISEVGVRRASVFLGLGVNAARDNNFNAYQLTHLTLGSRIEFTPRDVAEICLLTRMTSDELLVSLVQWLQHRGIKVNMKESHQKE